VIFGLKSQVYSHILYLLSVNKEDSLSHTRTESICTSFRFWKFLVEGKN